MPRFVGKVEHGAQTWKCIRISTQWDDFLENQIWDKSLKFPRHFTTLAPRLFQARCTSASWVQRSGSTQLSLVEVAPTALRRFCVDPEGR